MFDWIKKKKNKRAAAEAKELELRAKLAEKMKRWTPEQLGGEMTDYTVVDGKKVRVNRIDLGDTITGDGDKTEPELTLADTTDYKFDPRDDAASADVWSITNLADSGKWRKNNGKK